MLLRHFRFIKNFRLYSIKHATKPPTKFTDTINLPKTKFPNRLSATKREEIENQLLQKIFASAYSYQEEHNKEPTFVLHDGPPYANGDLHMGHAVNKILKDISVRQYMARGNKIHYIPGWDCHGLPIELKATTGEANEDPLVIRRKSRKFALEAMERQKEAFQAWGILGNWSNPDRIYLTIQPKFITRQLEMFYDFYERGLVYRDLKPVYWSPSSRTALAEAELEYDNNFVSPSVYVRFSLTNLPTSLTNLSRPIYALVWTTTPWTLPSNQAICYNSSLDYSLVKLQNASEESQELYLIASNLLKDFEGATNIKCEEVKKIKGKELSNCSYQHPIVKDEKPLKFFEAPHVQDTKGTGLVHTAPAHGPEDFLVSLQQKIPVISFVNEEGKYTSDAPEFLCGKSVLEEGDQLVVEKLGDDIVFAGRLTHSYPIDWRTKKPVIIRASEQWFMNTECLKARALEEVENIKIYPRVNAEASKKALEAQVRKRPYWCISRQRVWGAPIPVFYRKDNGKVIINRKIMEHICSLVEKHGNIDFWWSQPINEILPQNLLDEQDLSYDNIKRGSDIFDIWFDSGSSWSSVLGNHEKADLYLEGYDQFNGWFQSSLITSIAARNRAPYKSLFVHGFTVDEKGHKMSKSLGNVIVPKEITKKYGVDALRWWVASHATQNMSITVSEKLLQQSAESLSKLRSTLRYLNGVVGELNPKLTNDYHPELDTSMLNKYLLSTLVNFEKEVQRFYEAYEYNRVVALIQNYVAKQISAVYINFIKDRLYCGHDEELKAIRYTLTQCYEILCKALWPLTPFLVEESWSYYDPNSPFYKQPKQTSISWKNEQVENSINAALHAKRLVNQAAGDINTWNLSVDLTCNESTYSLLHPLHQQKANQEYSSDSELCEVLQVNRIKLQTDHHSRDTIKADEILVRIEPLESNKVCPRCRRFTLESEHLHTCKRCTNVLKIKC